ncbi:SapC family protein [Pigmentiphaga soli]|uniref:SapC family protein n=1 Tax=Pigmentiphaga soli TaxID=1007095 RepID=A0ABP8HJ84_9BURK
MSTTPLPLFYRQPRPLHPSRHGNRSLAARPDYRFAAGTNAVPLIAAELPVACRHYPIVFTAGDQPYPVAVLGLRGKQNLFVDEAGNWKADAYVPAYVRRYPFILMENEGATEFTLCVDETAGAFMEGRDNPFFDADGKPTDIARNALAFCGDYQKQHTLTAEFAQALTSAGLLVDNRADVALRNGEKLSLSGFRVIDEARFAKLSDKEFKRWRTKGWLPLVYAHLISVGTWTTLIDRLGPPDHPAA